MVIGIKTVQLAALVGPTGKVFAFENRQGRLASLKQHVELFQLKSMYTTKNTQAKR